MGKTRKALSFLVAAATWSFVVPQGAQAQSGIVAGSLSCTGHGTMGAVIGSSQRLSCVFTPAVSGPHQRYAARITRLGLDVGIQGRTQMIWTVLGPSNRLGPGMLAGNFVGVAANAALGVGGGGNALVGGSHNSIVLQPLSAQVQKGLSVAAGVAGLRLTYAGH